MRWTGVEDVSEPRTLDLATLRLSVGAHRPEDGEACAAEAANYAAGRPWSDQLPSAVIGAFVRAWNDSLGDDDRNRLLGPLVRSGRLTSTPSDDAREQRRAWLAVDWLCRTYAPAWLDAAGLTDHAATLRALAPVLDRATAAATNGPLAAAWPAARAAAWAAARDAARAAAGDAAGPAARDAAGEGLHLLLEALQASALNLLERMIAA